MQILPVFILPIATSALPIGIPGHCSPGWDWVPLPGTKCIDGQESGVRVRRSSGGNKNLAIFLNGGGACFNSLTCIADDNPLQNAFSSTATHCGSSGVFASRADNPLRDYNWLSVPYCTGDVYGGDVSKIFHGSLRYFSGAPNLEVTMAYAKDTFPDVEELFIMGISAGGFGSITMYPLMRDFFPNARGTLLDDSGPILDNEAMPVCLQEQWREAWNLNENLPKDCPCNNEHGGDLATMWTYLRKRYPKDSFGLISSVEDTTIATIFAYGNRNCSDIIPRPWTYTGLHDGLVRLANTTRTPVFMVPGDAHTHTLGIEFFEREVDSVSLYKWVGQLMDDDESDPGTVQPTDVDYFLQRHGITSIRMAGALLKERGEHWWNCSTAGKAIGVGTGLIDADTPQIAPAIAAGIHDKWSWRDLAMVGSITSGAVLLAFVIGIRVGRKSTRSHFLVLGQ